MGGRIPLPRTGGAPRALREILGRRARTVKQAYELDEPNRQQRREPTRIFSTHDTREWFAFSARPRRRHPEWWRRDGRADSRVRLGTDGCGTDACMAPES